MKIKKVRKTVIVAMFVSLAAQIHFSFLTEGFIIAMAAVVMAIFIYCYEDISPVYMICLSGLFSPVIRMTALILSGEQSGSTAVSVLPDSVYYFAYALFYTLIYRYFIRSPKTTGNFPYAVFFSDILSNLSEIGFRCMLTSQNLLSFELMAYLALVALCRTILVMMVIIAIDSYGSMLVSQEREREYRQLLNNAATVEAELSIMKKNAADVEEVTKTAYDLYYLMRNREYPADIVNSILSIAKNTHEIKGDYQNVLGVLSDTFINDLDQEPLWISKIISIERSNVLAMARKKGFGIDISVKISDDFLVKDPFKMMSVVRNLMTNSAEAIGTDAGRITIEVQRLPKEAHLISIRDNGPGISEDDISNLFLEGYSTKFDPRTGEIHRGLGLCVVKEYIENDYRGSISVKSKKGMYTEFDITIPAVYLNEDRKQ